MSTTPTWPEWPEQVAAVFDVPVEALTPTPAESTFIVLREQHRNSIAEAITCAVVAFKNEIESTLKR